MTGKDSKKVGYERYARVGLGLGLAILGGWGCIPSLGDLDGKACDASGGCAEGYVCDTASDRCVPEGQLTDAGDPGDAGTPDAATPDGGSDGGSDGGPIDAGPQDAGPQDAGPCSAPETCNLIDDDCDGDTDEGLTDADNDTYCDAVDCDDDNPLANPAQGEVCDGADNNCDGNTDEFDLAIGTACDMPGNSGVLGECVHGTTICENGGLACQPGTPAGADFCGRDDDCDGSTTYPPAPGDLTPATVEIDMGGLTEDTSAVPARYPLGLIQGKVQLRANIVPDTRYVRLDDAAASVTWHFITPGNGPRAGPVLEVGALSTGASLELAEGLHGVRMVYTDPCGSGEQSLEFVLEVGSPTGGSSPGGDTDFVAICTDPATERVWAASTGKVYSLQRSLSPISDTTLDRVRGCVVGPSSAAFFGRTNNGDNVFRFDDAADLTAPAEATVANNDGIVPLGIAAGDGLRPWIVSETRLKFYEPGAPGNFAIDGAVERPNGSNVRCVARESDSAIWVCSDAGVNRLDLSSFDPVNPSTATWTFPSNLTVFTEAGESGGTRADALVFDNGILWALTRDASNRLLRFDADAYRACMGTGCSVAAHVTSIDISGNPASPANHGDDLVVWSDGDLLIGSEHGVLRYQYCGPNDGCPSMMLQLHEGDTVDLDRMATGPIWSFYAASTGNSGEIFHYRGE